MNNYLAGRFKCKKVKQESRRGVEAFYLASQHYAKTSRFSAASICAGIDRGYASQHYLVKCSSVMRSLFPIADFAVTACIEQRVPFVRDD
jgi:hypothetical protein